MKKAISILAVLLFIGSILHAQSSWVQLQDIEEMFSSFDIQVDVWHNEGEDVINFEDVASVSFDDVLFQLSYIMTAFDFLLVDENASIEESVVQAVIYSYFRYNKNWQGQYDDRYDDDQFTVYDIYMERDWLIEFFNSGRRERDIMLYNIYDEHYNEWFPPLRKGVK